MGDSVEEMNPTAISRSYFQDRLAKRARQDEFAAPLAPKDLAQRLQYLPKQQIDSVIAASEFATGVHHGQQRRTGHSYITHPLAVANILASMRMDHQSIMAALLHDVLEDTHVDKETLTKHFGKQVAEIVDGVSKLELIFESHVEAQAENFQKLAIAAARDPRVILVKLADRLHNMRTIGVMPDESRQRIARETLDLYAPLAYRLGIYDMMIQLQHLAFEALYPLRSDRLARAVATETQKRQKTRQNIERAIINCLKREDVEARVAYQEKHLYSVYMIMRDKREPLSDIMDVLGFRVVVDSPDACYRVLGILHTLYKPRPGQFKDYIAIPKVNGYQALHTALVSDRTVSLEVQICTEAMDVVAHDGIAKRSLYESRGTRIERSNTRTHAWIQSIADLQQIAGSATEFLEHLKTDLFPEEVYVFTPTGEILSLPQGSCAIDFAYAIHTDIGNRCLSCRVNRKIVPLSRPLESGETVEITTSPDARPRPDWLNFTVTARARTGIRDALRTQQSSESIELGRRLLNRSLSIANTSIDSLDWRRLRKVFREFHVRKRTELFEEIGIGNLMAYVVAQRLLAADNPNYEAVHVDSEGPVAIQGGEGLVITFATCCRPIPGDSVVGHITAGRGLVVHNEACKNTTVVAKKSPNELIPARWSESPHGEFNTLLNLTVTRRKGVLAELADVLNSVDAGISDFTITERSLDVSVISVTISVRNRDHVAQVIRRVRMLSSVIAVVRQIN